MAREPLAVELYRRFINGETVEQISAELGIPAERVHQRLNAAAAYLARAGQPAS